MPTALGITRSRGSRYDENESAKQSRAKYGQNKFKLASVKPLIVNLIRDVNLGMAFDLADEAELRHEHEH